MSNQELASSPTGQQEFLYSPRNARTGLPSPHISSRATHPHQTMSSTYISHLANAEVPNLFQEISAIRANTENCVPQPRYLQPVRPDQILRAQHDLPSNPSDVLQYHLSSVADRAPQRGDGGGLSGSHRPILNDIRSPVNSKHIYGPAQYTPQGQLPSRHDGPSLRSLDHEDCLADEDGSDMPENMAQLEAFLSGSSPEPIGMRSSTESHSLKVPYVTTPSPHQELYHDYAMNNVAYAPINSTSLLFYDPESPSLQAYIDDYVKRQIELNPKYGAEFRQRQVIDLTGDD